MHFLHNLVSHMHQPEFLLLQVPIWGSVIALGVLWFVFERE